MTYGLLAAGFLAIAVVTLLGALTRAVDRRELIRRWRAPAAIAAFVLIALTVVFDNLMIAAGLMRYASPEVSGPAIGLMPALDLAYPVAAVILLPALWLLFRRKGDG
ncbi:lycopene cyclase domain-containing protein [Diaminobutyricibacter tongyongensis]|uniref:Lycopene cyclase domain-containing protein n=1 Tax=Leifsonia tongyongensis TaxID=1268043 RepID=A0A6L9XYG0_9MICO|nr:lycopene cyclase domain-containing protein [Diaminobutyricibacter tongyongensis]NEN06054.1 lycopene cyclase domain-containing protein [Diaminobutyricibacter tongyongensis]